MKRLFVILWLVTLGCDDCAEEISAGFGGLEILICEPTVDRPPAELPTRLTHYSIGDTIIAPEREDRASRELADYLGVRLVTGWHDREEATLDEIWGSPDAADVSTWHPYGDYMEARPYKWDALTLQVYPGSYDDLVETIDTVGRFIDILADAETKVYLYETCPADAHPYLCSVYFGTLAKELSRARSHDVFSIPVGQVLQDLRSVLEPVQFDSGLLEQYVSSVTVTSTLLGNSPEGAPLPDDYFHIDEDVVQKVQEVVWDVVSTHPRTGF